jgi:hypothetical protein
MAAHNDVSANVTPIAFVGGGFFSLPQLFLTDNLGYNPRGLQTSPVMTCGVPISNPFAQKMDVFVSGAFTSIEKNGLVMLSGAGVSASLVLGLGETLEIDCSSLPSTTWYAE